MLFRICISFFLLCFILSSTNRCFAQESRQFYVIDAHSLEPIPYVQIGLGSELFFSDESGYAKLVEIDGDTISLSRIGYRSMGITSNQIADTILLERQPYTIQEFVVSGRQETQTVGYHDFATIGKAEGFNEGFGVIIDSARSVSLIKSVLVSTKGNRKGFDYEVYLYQLSDRNRPIECFYTKRFTAQSGRNFLKFSLENEMVKISDKGVLVAVRWILPENFDSKKRPTMKMTAKVPKPLSYRLYENKWHLMDHDSLLGHDLNYQIGLELISQ